MLKHLVPSLIAFSLIVPACHDATDGVASQSHGAQSESCPTPTTPAAVLVDASHDGGVWWYPQVAPFDGAQPHQGQALADTLRGKGYRVDEQGRGDTVTRGQLLNYQIVIRAGDFGAYTKDELGAYEAFVACPRTLILLGEFLRSGEHDDLAERLGIPLAGWTNGTITSFASDPITAGVTAVPFIAGSSVELERAVSVRVLGWLDAGDQPVMGIQEGRVAKVFFIGDTNGLELVPQPLVDNIVAWGFAGARE